jgi:hypothetical protein
MNHATLFSPLQIGAVQTALNASPEAIHTWLIMMKVLQAIRHLLSLPFSGRAWATRISGSLTFYRTKGQCPLTPWARR